MITTTKNFSEQPKLSALNTFFFIWLFVLTIAIFSFVTWGIVPDFLQV